MPRDEKRPKIVSLRPDLRKIEGQIRELAKDTRNIIWGNHARERMVQRGILSADALRILRTGFGRELEGTEQNEWKVKMVGQVKGAREAGVLTVVMHDGRLFVKTVEWEDLR